MTTRLVIATGNRHKRDEIGRMLAPWRVDVVTTGDLGLPPADETADSFVGNALLKANEAFAATGGPCLADDSGLVTSALDGAPGVYSARFAGLDATDADNNRKLIGLMAGVPAEDRGAAFVCAIALTVPRALAARAPRHGAAGAPVPWELHDVPGHPDAVAFTVEGRCPGRIVDAPRGGAGFGYDPHFLYEPFGQTFAEIDQARKLEVSHRGRALRSLEALFHALFA